MLWVTSPIYLWKRAINAKPFSDKLHQSVECTYLKRTGKAIAWLVAVLWFILTSTDSGFFFYKPYRWKPPSVLFTVCQPLHLIVCHFSRIILRNFWSCRWLESLWQSYINWLIHRGQPGLTLNSIKQCQVRDSIGYQQKPVSKEVGKQVNLEFLLRVYVQRKELQWNLFTIRLQEKNVEKMILGRSKRFLDELDGRKDL